MLLGEEMLRLKNIAMASSVTTPAWRRGFSLWIRRCEIWERAWSGDKN
jgi:hypothetical protein